MITQKEIRELVKLQREKSTTQTAATNAENVYKKFEEALRTRVVAGEQIERGKLKGEVKNNRWFGANYKEFCLRFTDLKTLQKLEETEGYVTKQKLEVTDDVEFVPQVREEAKILAGVGHKGNGRPSTRTRLQTAKVGLSRDKSRSA